MASRSHFAAPLLLAVIVGLIVYVSLYPFRFVEHGPTLTEALRTLSWARAGRGDMFNNVLLYVPFGFCVALLVEPRWGRLAGIVAGVLLGATLSLGLELLQASVASRVSSLRDLSLNSRGFAARRRAGFGFSRARQQDLAAGCATQSLRLRRHGHPDAVAARAPLAVDSRPGPAPAQARRTAAADAARSSGRRSPASSSAGWSSHRPCSTCRSGSVRWTST